MSLETIPYQNVSYNMSESCEAAPPRGYTTSGTLTKKMKFLLAGAAAYMSHLILVICLKTGCSTIPMFPLQTIRW